MTALMSVGNVRSCVRWWRLYGCFYVGRGGGAEHGWGCTWI